ncbi:unnamed protein product [Mytilus coruscus]|uniref:CCHC-type domain-containing protein n=1 Tax=Mytilus coruscus TaxID=42192 RepID=A0A6J8BE86_MYTCO|nr:unnamed protein product [Mytilus coruscus]
MAKMMEAFSKYIDSLQLDLGNFKRDITRKDSDTYIPGWKYKTQCYNCGRFGHFRNECKSPKKQYNGNNGRGNGTVALYTTTVGTGVLKEEKLIIQKKKRPDLEPITQVIISANGTELSIAGKGKFCIEIGKEKFIVEALVADLSIDGILEDTSIPPGTEAFSRGRINDYDTSTCKLQIDRPKTAFATRLGLFQFRKMPFWLACAPAKFERLMERVIAGLQWNICLVYLDDIIVVGRNFRVLSRCVVIHQNSKYWTWKFHMKIY